MPLAPEALPVLVWAQNHLLPETSSSLVPRMTTPLFLNQSPPCNYKVPSMENKLWDVVPAGSLLGLPAAQWDREI